MRHIFLKKWANPGLFYRLVSVFFKQTSLQILQQINVHPVYGAGIQTHNLRNMSLLPYPLDQGSRPKEVQFVWLNFYEISVRFDKR